MRISFRQGIVRYQTDVADNPTFLRRTFQGGDTYVDLIVSPEPTLVAFADGTEDYLFEERETINQAWGPFSDTQDRWLYWDIDLQTGIRTFGSTTLEPITSDREPFRPNQDQHFFDLRDFTQKVYIGRRFTRRIRVFAAKLENGAVLKPFSPGTQVNLNTPVRAGFILFDNDDDPVQKAGQFNRGKFLTTDSPLSTQFTGAANFRLESLVITARSAQNLPAYTCVRLVDSRTFAAAAPAFFNSPCVGVINQEATIGSINRIVTSGVLTDENFAFNLAPGTPLFVGSNGLITSTPSQQFSIQRIGSVLSAKSILIDITQQIRYG